MNGSTISHPSAVAISRATLKRISSKSASGSARSIAISINR